MISASRTTVGRDEITGVLPRRRSAAQFVWGAGWGLAVMHLEAGATLFEGGQAARRGRSPPSTTDPDQLIRLVEIIRVVSLQVQPAKSSCSSTESSAASEVHGLNIRGGGRALPYVFNFLRILRNVASTQTRLSNRVHPSPNTLARRFVFGSRFAIKDSDVRTNTFTDEMRGIQGREEKPRA